MRYLVKYESFEFEEKPEVEKICAGWGIELEDLEDLFIEFSDDGGRVIISHIFTFLDNERLHPHISIIQITICDIWDNLNDSDWLYNPLWESRFARIKGHLNILGLNMNVIARSLNHGRFTYLRIFPIN